MQTVLAQQTRVAAFFDVDNTIMRGASIYHFARGLVSKKFLKFEDLAQYALAQGKFIFGGKENLNDMSRVTQNALAFVAGRKAADLISVADEIYDEIIQSKFWPGTVELAKEHLAKGHQVWLVSAAPHELADLIARKLGLTGAIATLSEIVEGKYTGRLVSKPMHGDEKALAVRKLANDFGIDLAKSFAYSDSSNDLPLLNAVGNPNAVNPDAGLRAHAKELNWPTYDYRRQHLVKRYGIPAGATAVALVASGAKLAITANRRRTSASNI